MPYCPECSSEYREGIDRCADCDVELVAELQEGLHDAVLVPIFACYNRQEHLLIRDLFETNSIPCIIRDLEMSSFPTTVGKTAEKRVLVKSSQVDQARQLLKQAIEEKALECTGSFL